MLLEYGLTGGAAAISMALVIQALEKAGLVEDGILIAVGALLLGTLITFIVVKWMHMSRDAECFCDICEGERMGEMEILDPAPPAFEYGFCPCGQEAVIDVSGEQFCSWKCAGFEEDEPWT